MVMMIGGTMMIAVVMMMVMIDGYWFVFTNPFVENLVMTSIERRSLPSQASCP